MRRHVKRRVRPAPGSIAAALDIFGAEVRFYRQIAPVAGVQVPVCHQASQTSEGTAGSNEAVVRSCAKVVRGLPAGQVAT